MRKFSIFFLVVLFGIGCQVKEIIKISNEPLQTALGLLLLALLIVILMREYEENCKREH